MQNSYRLTLSFSLILIIASSLLLFQAALGDVPPQVSPLVAIHISEYTQTHWTNPYWTYFSLTDMLEETFKADGTPFIEITDAQIAAGQLLSGATPRYPIFFSIAAECVSDAELNQISNYAQSGGFVYTGSSAWTKNEDGSPRSNFGLSAQMGLTCDNPPPDNWVNAIYIYRSVDSQLTNQIPKNVIINWRLPLSNHTLCTLEPTSVEPHKVWAAHTTTTDPATILLATDDTIMLAQKSYGTGMFIYHSELDPLASFSLYSPVAYEYLIIRQAVEWAFQNSNLPIAKLSAWPYQYDSAFVVRHDMDISYQSVLWMADSAEAEKNMGVTGQYYIVTGDVRDAQNSASLISQLQQADALGGQVGSHNGGLDCSPWDTNKQYGDYLYYHWGPDEAMNKIGTSAGMDYSNRSISLSFNDLNSWVGSRPRIWVAPAGQGCWDETYQVLDSLGVKTSGEFTTSPYPNFAFSVNTPNVSYTNYVVPFSRWITSSGFTCQSIEDLAENAPGDMQKLVDFYYDMGALVSPYSHSSSQTGLPQEFLQDVLAKPYMWNTNPTALWNWGLERQQVSSTPYFQSSISGVNNLTVTLSGSISPDTTLDVVLPTPNSNIDFMEVLVNGAPTANYRLTSTGVKVQAGLSTTVSVIYATNPPEGWTQTTQADFKSGTQTNLDLDSEPGQISLAKSVGFSDDFTDEAYTSSHWTEKAGSWTVSDGYYNLAGQTEQLLASYVGTIWNDYSVETSVRYVGGEYDGVLSAHVNPTSGSRYSLIVYPNQDGPNRIALMKFSSWADIQGTVLSLAEVETDTNFHNLRMNFVGNQIQCTYDGQEVFDVLDGSYFQGGIALESYGDSNAQFDYVHVSLLSNTGTFVSSDFDAGSYLVDWQALMWMADIPPGTTLQFRTRTATTQSALSSAEWSSVYPASGCQITSPHQRWIQYQITFQSNDQTVSPKLYGVTVTFTNIVPNPHLKLHIDIDMTAAIGELEYSESATSLPFESAWQAKDGTVYAGSNQVLYQSSDNGVTWSQLRNFGTDITMVYVDSHNYIYASTDQPSTQGDNGLWRSTDNGTTWNRVITMQPSTTIWGIDESGKGQIYAGVYTEGSAVSNSSILKSTDGGDTWNTIYYNSTARHVHDINIDKKTGYIYASIGDKLLPWNIAYVICSTDDGATWTQIRDANIQFLAIEAVQGARLFATDDPVNGAIYRSTDDQNFEKVLDTGGHSYGYWMRVNPLNGRVYASFVKGEGTEGTSVSVIYQSDDDGQTWQIYRTFTVSDAYYGSPSASNFVNGLMYYSVHLESGWQNGIRVAPNTLGSFLASEPPNSLASAGSPVSLETLPSDLLGYKSKLPA